MVAGEAFRLRIPRERAAGAQRDGPEVAHRRGAVADLHVADRQRARAHAVEEIAHVVRALVEPHGVGRERGGEQVLVAGLEARAVDPDPAVGALEADAVALAVLVHDPAEDVVVGRRADFERDAVGVGVVHLVVAVGVVAAGDGFLEPAGLDAVGREQADGPIGDVVVVRTPVGHRAAGILIPKAKRPVAALDDVVGARRLALPEIPVEPRRNRRLGKRPAAQSSRQPYGGFLEFSDAAVAHELAGEAETLRAALLRAGLQDDLVFAHGADHLPALVDRQRERLFGIHVLAGFRRGDVDQRVPVVGRGVDDHVNVLPRQQPAEIGIARGRLALDGEFFHGARDVGGIDIAHREHLAVAARVDGVARALAAAADQRDAGAVVGRGAGDGGFRGGEVALEKPPRQPGRGGGHRAFADERATREVEEVGRSGGGGEGGAGRVHREKGAES